MKKIFGFLGKYLITLVTIANVSVLLVMVFLSFANSSVTQLNVVAKYVFITVVLILFILNMLLYFTNRSSFKYKKNHLLKVFTRNFSRKFIYFISVTLIMILVDKFNSTNIYESWKESFVILLVFSLIFEIVGCFTEGLINGVRLILIIFVCYLASDKDFMLILFGSAGLKIVIEWLFSDEYLSFIELTNKKEDIELIRNTLNSLKSRVVSWWNIILISLNLVFFVRDSLSTNLKAEIFESVKKIVYRDLNPTAPTDFSDQFLIGSINFLSVGLVSVLFYYLFSKGLVKKIKFIMLLNKKEVMNMSKEQTKQVLNQLVADLSQQSVIVHQAHWYMRGATFMTMHPLMDQHMEMLDAQLDEVSERLITLGGAPYSTLREFADNTKIADAKGNYSDSMEDRIRHLLVGYRYLIDLYAKGIEVAGEEGDDVTQDIFTGAKGALEKLVWMLSATINEAPGL